MARIRLSFLSFFFFFSFSLFFFLCCIARCDQHRTSPAMARVKKRQKRTGSILLSRHRNTPGTDSAPLVTNPRFVTTSALSSKAGRTVIRKHHTLQKRLSQAQAKNDVDAARAVQAEIEGNGGLEKYQQASVCSRYRSHGIQRCLLLLLLLLMLLLLGKNK